jgi:hypothetical protein
MLAKYVWVQCSIINFGIKTCIPYYVIELFINLLTFFFTAKATYAAIAKTYAYLTPDLWRDVPLTKPPYSEHADYLQKNHQPNAPVAPPRVDA